LVQKFGDGVEMSLDTARKRAAATMMRSQDRCRDAGLQRHQDIADHLCGPPALVDQVILVDNGTSDKSRLLW
jgi:hypothetical protein